MVVHRDAQRDHSSGRAIPSESSPDALSAPSSAPTFIDWFIPDRVRHDKAAHGSAHVFVSTYLTGIPLAVPVGFYLYSITPKPGPALWAILAMICGFSLFPFVLKFVGRWIPVALAALQYFTALTFLAAYYYGGIASPFLPWLIIVGISVFFFFQEVPRLRRSIFGILALEIIAFFLFYVLGPRFPELAARGDLLGLALISSCAITFDVGLASLQFGNIVRLQQRDLEREIESRRITEISLRRAKEEAEIASRSKTEFLGNMSHELRTPLNAIIGFSDILAHERFGPLGEPRYAGYAQDIHDSGGHLLSLISDVLDIAKIELHQVALADEPVMVEETVASCVRLISERAKLGGVTVTVAMAPNLPVLRADERRLKQILLNLLSNAVKFTPAGGQVEIRASSSSEGLAIVFADSGIGMTKAEIAVAMTAFGQVDSSLARKYEGTGLGLPLALAMVQMHGGTLTVDSAPNRGTVITVVFPPDRMLPRTIAAA